MNEEALIASLEEADFNTIQVFSTKAFKKSFLVGGMMSFIINAVLVTMLILK